MEWIKPQPVGLNTMSRNSICCGAMLNTFPTAGHGQTALGITVLYIFEHIYLLMDLKRSKESVNIDQKLLFRLRLKNHFGASLVAQWLRIRPPMQGTRVRALVQEDPASRRATKPVPHNY